MVYGAWEIVVSYDSLDVLAIFGGGRGVVAWGVSEFIIYDGLLDILLGVVFGFGVVVSFFSADVVVVMFIVVFVGGRR